MILQIVKTMKKTLPFYKLNAKILEYKLLNMAYLVLNYIIKVRLIIYVKRLINFKKYLGLM